jgi:hypothetical protein
MKKFRSSRKLQKFLDFFLFSSLKKLKIRPRPLPVAVYHPIGYLYLPPHQNATLALIKSAFRVMNKVKTWGTQPLTLITIMGDSGGFKDKQPEIKVRLFQNSLCQRLFIYFLKVIPIPQ